MEYGEKMSCGGGDQGWQEPQSIAPQGVAEGGPVTHDGSILAGGHVTNIAVMG